MPALIVMGKGSDEEPKEGGGDELHMKLKRRAFAEFCEALGLKPSDEAFDALLTFVRECVEQYSGKEDNPGPMKKDNPGKEDNPFPKKSFGY